MSSLSRRKPREGQILQTKQAIFEAMIMLLDNQPFSTISFTALAEKAGVSRQSVYRHFSVPADILIWYIEKQFRSYLKQVKESPAATDSETVLRNAGLAFSFCSQNRQFLHLLIRHNLEYLFLYKIEEFVRIISRDFGTAKTIEQQFFREKYFAGGFFMFIINWVKSGSGNRDSEMIDMLAELVIL